MSSDMWGNPASTWLIALAVFFGSVLILNVARVITVHVLRSRVSVERLQALRELTIALVRQSYPFSAMIAWIFGSIPLTLTPYGERIVRQVAVLLLLLQIGFWGSSAIGLWMQRYRARKLDQDPGAVTVANGFAIISRAVLFVLIGLLAMQNFGIELSALLAGVGIASIVIGIAAQAVLGDLFASVAIIFDKPFVIGDFLNVGAFNGTVEHIGLKTTRLRSLTGEQLVFSNSKLLDQAVRNFRNMQERHIFFRFGVTYNTPHAKLHAIPGMIENIVAAQTHARFDRAHFVAYDDSSLNFEVAYYVLTPEYVDYLDVQQAVNLALYERFEQEGIAFAYPTRTVHVTGTAVQPAGE